MQAPTTVGPPVRPDGDAAAQALVLLFSRVIRRWKAHGPPQTLDPAAFVVLHEAHTKGPLRVSDLAAALHLDVSTVSRHVRNLEAAGHLHRTDDPDDRRACRLALTSSGKRLHTEIHERRAQVLSAAMARWSERDRRQLLRLLERLADDLAPGDAEDRTP